MDADLSHVLPENSIGALASGKTNRRPCGQDFIPPVLNLVARRWLPGSDRRTSQGTRLLPLAGLWSDLRTFVMRAPLIAVSARRHVPVAHS